MECNQEKVTEFATSSEDRETNSRVSPQTDIPIVSLHQSILRQHHLVVNQQKDQQQQQRQFDHPHYQEQQQQQSELQQELEQQEEETNQMLVSDLTVQRTTQAHPRSPLIYTHVPHETCNCRICGVTFKSESKLRVHQVAHSKSSAWTCSLCPLKYKRPADLNRHMKRKHGLSLMKNDKNVLVPIINSRHQLECQDMQPLNLSLKNYFSDASMESAESLDSEMVIDEDEPLDLSANKSGPIDYRQKTLSKSTEQTSTVIKNACQTNNDFHTFKYNIPTNSSNHGNFYPGRPSISAPAIRYRPFKCSECGRRSNWRWDLNKHIRTSNHPQAHLIELSEHVARATFHEVLKKDGSYSYDNHHQNAVNFALNSCGAPVNESLNGNSVSKFKPYMCNACGYRSNWKCDMSKHVRSLHDTAGVTLLAENIARETVVNYEKHHGGNTQVWKIQQDEASNSVNIADNGGDFQLKANEYVVVKCNSTDGSFPFSSSHTVDARKTKKFKCSACPYRSNFRSDVGRHIRHKHDRATCRIVVMSEAEAASTLGEYMDTWARKKFVPSPNKRRCLMSLTCSHPGQIFNQAQVYESKLTSSSTSSTPMEQSEKASSSSSNDIHNDGQIKTTKAKRWWKCSSCDYRDQSKDIIVQHWHYQHNNVGLGGIENIPLSSNIPKNYQSEICSEEFQEKIDEINLSDAPLNFKSEASKSTADSSSNESSNMTQNKDSSYTEVKKLACSICPYRTNTADLLNIHKSYHIPKEGNTYSCSFCPYFVCALPLLNQHLLLHNEDFKKLQANQQKTSISEQNSGEMKKVDDSNSPINLSSTFLSLPPCEQQDRPQDKVSVFLMTNAVRTGGRTTYLCSQCPYVSCNRNDYLYHRQFHRPRPTAFKCPHCPYWVSQKRLLSQHYKVHEFDYQQKHRGQDFVDAKNKQKMLNVVGDDNNNVENFPQTAKKVNESCTRAVTQPIKVDFFNEKVENIKEKCEDEDDPVRNEDDFNPSETLEVVENKTIFFENLGLTSSAV